MVETAIQMEEIEATIDSLYSDNEVLNYFDEHESLEVFEIEEQKNTSSKNLSNIVFSHVRSLSLVTKNKASDEFLYDLLKRDKLLFHDQTCSPWNMKKQMNQEAEKVKSLGEGHGKGYIVYIQFKSLLKDLVIEHLETIVSYSAKKSLEQDVPIEPRNFEKECVPIRIIAI